MKMQKYVPMEKDCTDSWIILVWRPFTRYDHIMGVDTKKLDDDGNDIIIPEVLF